VPEQPTTDADLDLAVVVGTLSSDPVRQTLSSGSTLVRYEVTVRDRSPADTVPVSWLDPRRVPGLSEGDRVLVVGRVRRRFFRAGGATRSATEVAASTVCRVTAARAAAALDDAVGLVDARRRA
jgi:single-strand DNA-binding protein